MSQPHADVTSPVPPEMVVDLSREQLEAAYLAIRSEYNTTVLVVAVLAERLLERTGGVMLTITDEALSKAPDLDAHRNTARRAVLIRTSR